MLGQSQLPTASLPFPCGGKLTHYYKPLLKLGDMLSFCLESSETLLLQVKKKKKKLILNKVFKTVKKPVFSLIIF